jgi:ribonuclease I
VTQTPTTAQASAYATDAVATLQPAMRLRRLLRVTINGPRGSRAEFYLGSLSTSARFDQTGRGESNTAEYTNPQEIPAGMVVHVRWPNQASRAGQCSATFTTEP